MRTRRRKKKGALGCPNRDIARKTYSGDRQSSVPGVACLGPHLRLMAAAFSARALAQLSEAPARPDTSGSARLKNTSMRVGRHSAGTKGSRSRRSNKGADLEEYTYKKGPKSCDAHHTQRLLREFGFITPACPTLLAALQHGARREERGVHVVALGRQPCRRS